MTGMWRWLALSGVMLAAGCGRHGGDSATEQGAAPPTSEITYRTADGWTIHGDYTQAPAATRAVVLLHQRNGRAVDWSALVPRLAANGITTLAIDQRGAGRSTGPSNGDDAPWDTTPDIAGAIAWLRQRGLAPKHIGLVGASYGANNALIYAAAHPEVHAVALLSPGSDYHGLKAGPAAAAYRGAILTVWSTDDTIVGTGPADIGHAAKGTREERSYSGDAHGTDLFASDPDSLGVIADFLKAQL